MMRTIIAILCLLWTIPAISQPWIDDQDSARFYAEKSNYQKAIAFLYHAKKSLRDRDSVQTYTYARICNNLATYQYTLSNLSSVDSNLVESKAVIEKLYGKESPAYITLTNNLGLLYSELNKLDEAEKLLLESKILRAKTAGPNSLQVAYVNNNLAALYRSREQRSRMVDLLKESEKIYRINQLFNHEYATICANLGVALQDVAQYDSARFYLFKSLRLREELKGRNNEDYATSCNVIASYYSTLGYYDSALIYKTTAKDIYAATVGKNTIYYANACWGLAGIYTQLSKPAMAGNLLEEARVVYLNKYGRVNTDYASILRRLADYYENTGLYHKAETYYQESIDIVRMAVGPKHTAFARALQDYALFKERLNQWDEAENLLLQAFDILDKQLGRDNLTFANLCHSLANLYCSRKNFDMGIPLLLEVKKIYEAKLGPQHRYSWSLYRDLGDAYRIIKQVDSAKKYYALALPLIEKMVGQNSYQYASFINSLYYLYAGTNELSRAKEMAEKSLSIYQTLYGKDYPPANWLLLNLANIYWRLGDKNRAAAYFDQSATQIRHFGMQQFPFLSAYEKEKILAKQDDQRDMALSFYLSDGPGKYAREIFTLMTSRRNIILNSLNQFKSAIRKSNDPAARATFDEWVMVKNQLARQYLSEDSVSVVAINSLTRRAESLEKKLVTQVSGDRPFSNPQISVEDIQKRLSNDEAFIDFIDFQYYYGLNWTDTTHYLAVIITKNNPTPLVVPLFRKKELEDIITKTDGERKIQTFYSEGLFQADGNGHSLLYNLIWSKIDASVRGIKRIYYVPSGLLYNLSLPALRISAETYLSDVYQLVQLSSEAAMLDIGKPMSLSRENKIYLVGGVNYDQAENENAGGATPAISPDAGKEESVIKIAALKQKMQDVTTFSFLKNSLKEVEAISKLAKQKGYQARLITGPAATETYIKSLPELSNIGVLHLATHGYFFQQKTGRDSSLTDVSSYANEYLKSFLVLAGANISWNNSRPLTQDDGILTSYEISGLTLDNNQLLVLSACESGLGQIKSGEGVFGLQRAFKETGAGFILMSLWKVPDDEADVFMTGFYTRLFEGKNIIDAFEMTRRELRRLDRNKNNPFRWAGFTLVY